MIHVAGTTDEGFRIIGVWENKAAWERFEAKRQREHASAAQTMRTTFRALRPKHLVRGRLPAA